MDNAAQPHHMDKHSDKVTLTNGYWFYFRDENRQFAIHGSGYSGKESVYLNDQLISSLRNYRRHSQHQFNVAQDNYRVEFNVTSILKGEIVCSLYKNEQLLETETKAYTQDTTSTSLKKIGLFFVGGIITGALAGLIAAKLFG